MRSLTSLLAIAVLAAGCGSADIPQAHKGQMFDRTGALAFYSGGSGLSGSVLNPGTYWTGIYDELRMVDCSQETLKEELASLTRDNVQFKVDLYITYNADCSDASVLRMLSKLTPDKEGTISKKQLYETYVRPAIGEAVRECISPHVANDINEKREEILANIAKRFLELIKLEDRKFVQISAVTLSNMIYPKEMDEANTLRAVQAVLKDKAIAERAKVEAETLTAETKRMLAEKEGEVEAAKIDKIGAALRRNPEYLQFDIQNKMPKIYEEAGKNGNLVITAPSPSVFVTPKGQTGK